MSTANKYLKAWADFMPLFTFGDGTPSRHREPTPRLVCADGFSISIQAGEYLYCQPRENDAFPYTKVEVGFPSESVPQWIDFAEEPGQPTETVYGYTPVDLVDEVIEAHGGVDIEKINTAIGETDRQCFLTLNENGEFLWKTPSH